MEIIKKKYFNIFFPLFFLTIYSFVSAQNTGQIYEVSDSLIFVEKINLAQKKRLDEKPLPGIFAEIARSFIGTEYRSHSIETRDGEKLKVCFTGLDCYTFVESSLAFARIIKENKLTFAELLDEIRNLRYRNGEINGYDSRLHYFTDWIFDLSRRGIVRDKTREIGGVPYKKNIDFMSKHSNAYFQLKVAPRLTEKIRQIEKEISSRPLYYVPENKIEEIENKISEGDIIAVTTSIEGLDVSHVGIAVKQNNRVYLLHAPNIGSKVQISEKPLSDYIKSHAKQTGIIVVEVTDIKQ